ncbi:hypothetical protein EIZ39_05675 [Ammoniphilus sp. CFH 90114]|nr:hypothetical protein EIZ39_05675 [Ammoniphilus sp. CFH 90114]
MRNPSAYTLLELTLVLSLLSLFFIAAMPVTLQILNQQKTKAFVQLLASDMYLASNAARTRQVETVIDIFPSYSFYILKIDGKQVRKVEIPKGNKIKTNYPNQRVTFYGDGQVSRAGTIEIVDTRGKVYQLVVQMSSGRFWIRYV